MNRQRLIDTLASPTGEGIRLKPYRDTVGKLTIGIGRNLDDVGISEDEARDLAMNDILHVERDLSRLVPCFTSLDDVRQRVLAELAFNMGVGGLLKFRNMLAAVAAHDFERATTEMLDSVAAREWGEDRRRRLTVMLREGQDS